MAVTNPKDCRLAIKLYYEQDHEQLVPLSPRRLEYLLFIYYAKYAIIRDMPLFHEEFLQYANGPYIKKDLEPYHPTELRISYFKKMLILQILRKTKAVSTRNLLKVIQHDTPWQYRYHEKCPIKITFDEIHAWFLKPENRRLLNIPSELQTIKKEASSQNHEDEFVDNHNKR